MKGGDTVDADEMISRQNAAIIRLNELLTQAKGQVATLTGALHASQDKQAALRRQLGGAEGRIKRLEQQVKDLQDDVNEWKSWEAKARGRADQLQLQADAAFGE